MAKQLTGLSDTARTIVYTMIVAAIKSDPVLQAVRPAINWMTYLGEASHQIPYDRTNLPAIELTPFALPASPEATTIQNSPMAIRLVVTVPGLDVRDLLNLWGAVEGSIFKGAGGSVLRNAIQAELTAKAPPAAFQTLVLSQPAVWNAADVPNGMLSAEGFITANMTVGR